MTDIEPGSLEPRHRSPNRVPNGWWKVVLAIAVVAALGAGLVAVVISDSGTETEAPTASKLILLPVADPGTDAFSTPMVPSSPDGAPIPDPQASSGAGSDQVDTIVERLNPPIGDRADIDFSGLDLPESAPEQLMDVGGSTPALYGGTNIINVCDLGVLKRTLGADAERATAWAEVEGVGVDGIDEFLDGLTDVILQADTRVTSHGYRNEVADAVDSVLQAGTAILVDELGIPRVRCYSGNPVRWARPLDDADPALAGRRWDGFSLDETITISELDDIVEFELDDILTDALVIRKPGPDLSGSRLVDQDGNPVEPTTGAADPDDPPDTSIPLGTGDVQVTVTWDNQSDIDLAVTEPGTGFVLSYDERGPTIHGGRLDRDDNFPCDSSPTDGGVENAFWPAGQAPAGTYVVSITQQGLCGAHGEGEWTVEVQVRGAVVLSEGPTVGSRTFEFTVD